MRATIEFKLPEDQEEYDMTMSAGVYYRQLFDIDRMLRDKLKCDDGLNEGERFLAEQIRDMIDIH